MLKIALNHYNFLYPYYSSLLTQKQCEVFENYYFEDYSLSEISEAFGVSRNAIWDLLKKVEHNLDEYEEKLGLYKKNQVLKNVNMNIKKGDIYGFVGENGSGKTTIIRLITGLIHPTSGTFELFGVSNNDSNIKLVRKKIGAVVETPSIYKNMTAYESKKRYPALGPDIADVCF